MTGPGIHPAHLLRQGHIAEADEAVPERTEGEGHFVLPGEHNDTREAEFKVPRRFEAEFLSVDPRRIRIAVALQRAEQKFIAKWSCEFGEYRNAQRRHAINAQAINGLRVVAERQAP